MKHLRNDIDWDSVPVSVKNQYERRRKCKVFWGEIGVILAVGGPGTLVALIFILFRTWADNWMDYPRDSLIFKWRELWRFLSTDGAGLMAFLVFLVLLGFSIKLLLKRQRIVDEEWDIYLDELSRKYPRE